MFEIEIHFSKGPVFFPVRHHPPFRVRLGVPPPAAVRKRLRRAAGCARKGGAVNVGYPGRKACRRSLPLFLIINIRVCSVPLPCLPPISSSPPFRLLGLLGPFLPPPSSLSFFYNFSSMLSHPHHLECTLRSPESQHFKAIGLWQQGRLHQPPPNEPTCDTSTLLSGLKLDVCEVQAGSAARQEPDHVTRLWEAVPSMQVPTWGTSPLEFLFFSSFLSILSSSGSSYISRPGWMRTAAHHGFDRQRHLVMPAVFLELLGRA